MPSSHAFPVLGGVVGHSFFGVEAGDGVVKFSSPHMMFFAPDSVFSIFRSSAAISPSVPIFHFIFSISRYSGEFIISEKNVSKLDVSFGLDIRII